MTNTLWTKIHISGFGGSKEIKDIDPQMNIQMGNHKLLTQMPGELEHAVKFRCSHNCTLDDIANSSQDVRKGTNIGKYTHIKAVVSKINNLSGWSLKTNPEKEGQR
ncbi:hypothetical protein O181_030409 [Austropuccinia psidii MF-1]|uniref:Uncharacterized protein n=1 Tax=Austropuccinia psidii MF-1 TaxID=1389203 RepID=A0A9Q3CSU9_9BASI|nr:hypothetical protein [Austropuccinia psidii MF-1]